MLKSLVFSLSLGFLVPCCAVGGVEVGDNEPHAGDERADDGSRNGSLRDDAVPLAWSEQVALGIDATTLGDVLANGGVTLPQKSAVFAARIDDDGDALSYRFVHAGRGAFSTDFWPASSIKFIAALGALERVSKLGYRPQQTHAYYGSRSYSLRSLVYEAVVDSSNTAYSRLVQIAGLPFLNDELLTAERGFGATVLQRSYDPAIDVRSPPTFTISGGWDNDTVVEAGPRDMTDYGGGQNANVTNLFELTEALRRFVLRAHVEQSERFALDDSDWVVGDLDQILDRNGSFFEQGARAALGDESARTYNKVGYVPGESCIDAAVITNFEQTERYLLAAYTPFEQGCATLERLPEIVLPALRATTTGVPLRSGPQSELAIEIERARGRDEASIRVAPESAVRVELYDASGLVATETRATGGVFAFRYAPRGDDGLLVVRAFDARGRVVAHRAARGVFR